MGGGHASPSLEIAATLSWNRASLLKLSRGRERAAGAHTREPVCLSPRRRLCAEGGVKCLWMLGAEQIDRFSVRFESNMPVSLITASLPCNNLLIPSWFDQLCFEPTRFWTLNVLGGSEVLHCG